MSDRIFSCIDAKRSLEKGMERLSARADNAHTISGEENLITKSDKITMPILSEKSGNF